MSETNQARGELTRTTLAVLFIVGLIGTSFWILRPFLPAIIWATTIVVATWPVMRAVQARLGGRRSLAVVAMTGALLLVFVIPFALAIGTILTSVDDIVAWLGSMPTLALPVAPDWLQRLPLVGSRAAAAWNEVAVKAPEELAQQAAPYASTVMRWFVSEAGSIGALSLQFLLTVIVSGILYSTGETAVAHVLRIARRLAGERGDQVVRLVGQAIRGVALGVVVTAFLQALLGGIGLAVAGVPFAPVLTAVIFMLSIAQIGPLPVLGAGVGYLFWTESTGWGVAMLVWTLIVGALDNVLRPILIRRGANLPLLLIFAGVIGGLVAFGLVGIFVGPAVLAVAHTLLDDWARAPEPPAPAAVPAAAE